MSRAFHPWQLLVTILAGWMNEQQQQLQLIEYLRTENQVLKETHGRKRIALNDDQRRRLAVKGKVLGRKLLGEIGTLVTPDTILRWHRMLVAEKWNHVDKRKAGGRRWRRAWSGGFAFASRGWLSGGVHRLGFGCLASALRRSSPCWR